MAYLLGKNAKAYYNGTAVSATVDNTAVLAGTEVSNITDLKISVSQDSADVTTRGSNGWKQTLSTQKDATITFSMIWKPADAAFTAIKNAWTNSAEIAFFALDQANSVTGAQGLVGNFTVSKFDKDESLSGAQKVDVELKPSSYNAWYAITGS